jgi:hypothetical protein
MDDILVHQGGSRSRETKDEEERMTGGAGKEKEGLFQGGSQKDVKLA